MISNKDGENYDSLEKEYSDPDSLMSKKLNLIDNLMKNATGALLDIGIGTGELIKKEGWKFHEVFGIDIDQRAIDLCNRDFKNDSKVKLLRADIRSIGELLPREKFDYVTCLDILEHITSEESEQGLKSINSLLRDGGFLLITTPGILDKVMIFLGKSRLHRQAHSSFGWVRMCRKAGFQIVSVETVEFPMIRSELLRKRLHIFGKCCLIACRKGTIAPS